MPASDKNITDHALRMSAVRIDLESQHVGSGFFVAPGVVVTCWHVVQARPSLPSESRVAAAPISVVAAERMYEVTDVTRPSAEDDLAVLRISPADADHCVLLGTDAQTRDELVAFAFPERHPEGAPTMLRVEGRMGDGRSLKLREGQVVPGMAGAPVLNLRTGAVCGILNRTRSSEESLGGYAITVERLFQIAPELQEQNRRYHSVNRTQWFDLLPPQAQASLGFEPLAGEPPGGDEVGRDGRDKVEWVADSLGVDDLLQRRPLARSLSERLKRMHLDDRSMSSFLVHVDGPWGSGKSTILTFLQEGLEPEWLIVDFNAWRQSRVGLPWWALLMELRRRLIAELGLLGKLRLRVAETWSRITRTGAPYALALVLLAILALAVFLVLKPAPFTTKTGGDLARSVTAIVAAVATLWAGGLVAARFLLWDSPRGARVYEQQSHGNPMENLADHFAWLVARVGRPVAFFIDDLDRCPGTYVVELLEAVQTLVRDSSQRWNQHAAATNGHATNYGPYFVIAADGKWIRTSYELEYDGFITSVDEPGRPLGYLFVDKLFQLRVPVPVLNSVDQRRYLSGLLRLGQRESTDRGEVDSVRANLQNSRSDSDVVEVLKSASPTVRRVLAPEAITKLTDPQVEAATEHALEKFAGLLEPNPRSMKRFVNAFGIARVVLTLENRLVPTDSLALWTILEGRWPILADHLRSRPEDVRFVGNVNEVPPNTPEALSSLYSLTDVAELVSFRPGGPLTSELISACASGASMAASGA